MIICKNCSNEFEGNFCNICGQSADVDRIDFHSLWRDAVSVFFKYYEKGILFSIKELFTRPGHTTREYLDGKRVNHFKPFSLLVMFAATYGLICKLWGVNFFENVESIQLVRNSSYFAKINEWVFYNYSFTIFLTLPIFTISSFLVFRKHNYSLAEHLIINTFMACQRMIYRVLTLPFLFLAVSTHHLYYIKDFYILFDFLFMIWSFVEFFETHSKIKIIAKSILNYCIVMIAILSLTIIIFSFIQ